MTRLRFLAATLAASSRDLYRPKNRPAITTLYLPFDAERLRGRDPVRAASSSRGNAPSRADRADSIDPRPTPRNPGGTVRRTSHSTARCPYLGWAEPSRVRSGPTESRVVCELPEPLLGLGERCFRSWNFVAFRNFRTGYLERRCGSRRSLFRPILQ
jgi:hypothetical protein